MLCCSALEVPTVTRHTRVDVFDEDDRSLDDIKTIHTPVEQALGDPDPSRLRGRGEALAESLMQLLELEPDAVPWIGFVDDTYSTPRSPVDSERAPATRRRRPNGRSDATIGLI